MTGNHFKYDMCQVHELHTFELHQYKFLWWALYWLNCEYFADRPLNSCNDNIFLATPSSCTIGAHGSAFNVFREDWTPFRRIGKQTQTEHFAGLFLQCLWSMEQALPSRDLTRMLSNRKILQFPQSATQVECLPNVGLHMVYYRCRQILLLPLLLKFL